MGESRREFLQRTLSGVVTLNAVGTSAICFAQESSQNVTMKVPTSQITTGLAYLSSRQNSDGSFGEGLYRENPGVNSLVGLAFLAAGVVPSREGEYQDVIDRTLDWLLRRIATQHIADTSDTTRGPMYSLGFATLFLAECCGMSDRPELGQMLRKAVRWIAAAQNHEGGWRYQMRPEDADISVTVCEVMALRAARNAGVHIPKEVIDRAIGYIRRCQNPDGGFMYMRSQGGVSAFSRSAAALAGLYSCGIYDDPMVDKVVQYLMRFCPGETAEPVDVYYFYGHYYAAMAMWQRGGPEWNRWYPAVRDELCGKQQRVVLANQPVGYWTDSGISPEFATATALLALQVPLERLPIFQR